MNVLFDCHMPSFLAHGGAQIQAINTVKALREIAVNSDFVRWWDPEQPCDIVHFLGRADGFYSGFARKKGIKFVLADLLTAQGSRTQLQRLPHFFLRQFDRLTKGQIIANKYGWTTYRTADAVIALTPWEQSLMVNMFRAPLSKTHVVPNGVEEVFFQNHESRTLNASSPWLICTATITERKRVLELAEAAVASSTPVWIIGKPYSDNDPYFLKFLDLVRNSQGILRYEGSVSDREEMAKIYKASRGFVLLSTMESLSLSALEASAAGCPLLLSDLPWAKCSFESHASYCPITDKIEITALVLKNFYSKAPHLPVPPKPKTWIEIAQQLKTIYEKILGGK